MDMQNNPEQTTREDLPLKAKKSTSTCEECLGGSKFINISFGSLSFVITVALLLQIYYGDYQVVPHGSVATDSLECSEIGTTILKKGGNAVDAALASTFCLSVFAPHITGLDADGQLLLYNHRTRDGAKLVDFSDLAISTNLPRLILGLAFCHKKYGFLPWKDLILPSIKFARNGFLVSKGLVQAIQLKEAFELFGHLEASQTMKLERLAQTLENVADISDKQLDSFTTGVNSPVDIEAYKFKFKEYNIFVPNSPSIGPILAVIMQQIQKHNFSVEDTVKTSYFHNMIEITRIVYDDLKLRSKFHEGVSTNVAVVDKNENYVSLISGLTDLFGSGEMTALGYIMNARRNKGIRYNRVPIIIVNSHRVCGRRVIFGANNLVIATQIISSLLLGNENATGSIESPRFHMASDGKIGFERFHYPFFDKELIQYLQTLSSAPSPVLEPYDSVNIVEKIGDTLSSHSDSRGGGIASRFK